MKKLSLVLTGIFLILSSLPVEAQTFFTWRYREHATDCTLITDGKNTDLCYEVDDAQFYKCKPSIGACDTPGEWTKMNPWLRSGTNIFLSNSLDNVGVGTSAPGAKLDVAGICQATEFQADGGDETVEGETYDEQIDFFSEGDGFIKFQGTDGGQDANLVMGLDGPRPKLFSDSHDSIFIEEKLYTQGHIGIGGIISSGQAGLLLQVGAGGTPTTASTGDAYIVNDLEVDGVIYGNGSGITNVPSAWIDNGTTVTLTTITDSVGIGTASPTVALDVAGTVKVNSGSSAASEFTGLKITGHYDSLGSAPVLTSCGTSPSISGTDTSFTVTGGASATGCTITFAAAFTNSPHCVVSQRAVDLTNSLSYTVSSSQLVITQTGFDGNVIDVICKGDG